MLTIAITILTTAIVVAPLSYLLGREYHRSELVSVAIKARRKAYRTGFNTGWEERGESLRPFVDQEAYEKTFDRLLEQ